MVLWFGPGVLLVLGLGLAWFYVARLNRSVAPAAPLSASEEEAVRRVLDGDAERS